MKKFTILNCAVLIFFCTLGHAQEGISKELGEEIARHGFLQHLGKGKTPLMVIELNPKEVRKVEVSIAPGKHLIGAILKNGYEMSRKYRMQDVALRVEGINPVENFGTSYSAFADFSFDQHGKASLTLTNTTSELVVLVLYAGK